MMTKSTWKVDPTHSTLEFTVKHMMISSVKGTFNDFDAHIEANPEDLTDATIEFTIDVNSVDTRNKDRDDHLRSEDFFDANNHPQMTFTAISITKKDDQTYKVLGDFTIRGTTKRVPFDITYEGTVQDPYGNEVAGFSGHTTIDRKDFGLTWGPALETGGLLIGEDVKINLEIQMHKQK